MTSTSNVTARAPTTSADLCQLASDALGEFRHAPVPIPAPLGRRFALAFELTAAAKQSAATTATRKALVVQAGVVADRLLDVLIGEYIERSRATKDALEQPGVDRLAVGLPHWATTIDVLAGSCGLTFAEGVMRLAALFAGDGMPTSHPFVTRFVECAEALTMFAQSVGLDRSILLFGLMPPTT